MDLGVGLVERNLLIAVAADEGDAGLVTIIKDDELMALARDEPAPLYLAVVEEASPQVGGVLAVVEAADDVGSADVAELEGHQDLVVDFRDPDGAAVGARAQLGQPRPVRLVV